VRPIERYRDRLILYGCGDFIDDYEGITGYEAFRGDLKVRYLIDVNPAVGRVVDARLTPLQMKRFGLSRASDVDTHWLCRLLDTLGRCFDTRVRFESDGGMSLHR
jgi:poly-gamma-glutamate synthesis protein (capsule biosynthesis protein)